MPSTIGLGSPLFTSSRMPPTCDELDRHGGTDHEWVSFSAMSSNGKWSTADVPDQSGRVAIVTGDNTGLGYHTAEVLAQCGAHVVLSVLNLENDNFSMLRFVPAHP